MNIPDFTSITVINSYSESKLKEKGSTFIGQAYPVENPEEALTKLAEVRKKYYDATHNCWAYRIYNGIFKYSDDGEPGGTAGIRIYNAIEHFNLQNLIVIVTRYYGGVKLGVGPLGKAYYNSAFEAVEKCEKQSKKLYQKIKVTYDFSFTKTFHKILGDYKGIIVNNSFEESPVSECLVNPSIVESLSETIINASSGKAMLVKSDIYIFK